MATTLNQILGIEKGVKNQSHEDLTNLYRESGRTEKLAGVSRTYDPIADDGERFPDETSRVQLRLEDTLKDIATSYTRLLDVVATKDYANTEAAANVVVDGDTLLRDVPATHLLFLEQELQNLHTQIKTLPVLSLGEDWEYDEEAGVYATKPSKTAKGKKNPRVLVKYEATDKHPAQVDVWYEDEVVGYWTTKKFSGALPVPRKIQLLDRTRKLLDAVRYARAEANRIEVTDVKEGKAIFDYLLAE